MVKIKKEKEKVKLEINNKDNINMFLNLVKFIKKWNQDQIHKNPI
jgi:hypothetical protein